MFVKNTLFLLCISLLALTSCKDQTEKDEELILDYLATNSLDAQRTDQGLYYIIETAGNDRMPSIEDQLKVEYQGYLLDGTVFDSTVSGDPVVFPLYNVIAGWQIGLPLIGEGGRIKLIVPSELAYGPTSPSSLIPENSVLIFDIDLIDVF